MFIFRHNPTPNLDKKQSKHQFWFTQTKKVIGGGYFDSNAFYDPDYDYNQDVVRNAARMRQNQKQTQQLPQNPQQQQQMQMQQNKMLGGPNMKPMDKTMGNMQQMQNLPGQQNKQNQMVIIDAPPLSPTN